MAQDMAEDRKTVPEAPGSEADHPALSPAETAAVRARMRRRNRIVAVLLVLFCAVAFAWMLIRFGLH